MSKKLSLAYIFQQQQLLVDQHFQLPQVEALTSDLLLNPGDQVVARDLLPDEPIPEGLQLVPIRQLFPAESRVKSKDDLKTLGIKTFFCSNVCAMYEKAAYDRLGGFIRRTIFNEDMIYAGGLIQKDYKIAYVAEAEVIHSHNYNALEQFHRNFDLAVSQTAEPIT